MEAFNRRQSALKRSNWGRRSSVYERHQSDGPSVVDFAVLNVSIALVVSPPGSVTRLGDFFKVLDKKILTKISQMIVDLGLF